VGHGLGGESGKCPLNLGKKKETGGFLEARGEKEKRL